MLFSVAFYFLIIISAFVANIMSFSFNTAVANNGLREPSLPQTNSWFPLRLPESQEMFDLGQICQNFEAQCFSQSECALYGNIIINLFSIQFSHPLDTSHYYV